MKSSPKKPAKTPQAAAKEEVMPLGAMNYAIIALGAAVIAASYAGMYMERQVDGFFSLNVAPGLLIASYLLVLYGIFHRPRKKGTPERP